MLPRHYCHKVPKFTASCLQRQRFLLSTSHKRKEPWVKLKYFTNNHPSIFPSLINEHRALPGDLVTIYDKEGKKCGHGLFDPNAKISLRVYLMLWYFVGNQQKDEVNLDALLVEAIQLRLSLGLVTCFRVVNAEGDNMSGFVVDNIGVYERLARWLPIIHKKLGTKYEVIQHEIKGSQPSAVYQARQCQKKTVVVEEYEGIKFRVNFDTGHKTGFFCDQRENRKRIFALAKGRRVLDLCCYTGGFSIYAAKGGAQEVIGVDLDEDAIKQAQENSTLNKLEQLIRWEHSDSFSFARMLKRQNKQFDIVILDPPKFISGHTPKTMEDGKQKYIDMNLHALGLVATGGYFVTCSCSGRLSMFEFEEIVTKAAHKIGILKSINIYNYFDKIDKRLQILDKTGAGMDHPVMSNFLEGTYLKVLWTRVM